MGGIQTPVVGIGTVELPVKRSPRATGPRSHGILRLRNVLHVPTGICNVIGSPILDEYDIHTGSSMKNTKGTIIDKQGRYHGANVGMGQQRSCALREEVSRLEPTTL
ncbi:hypothetical protein EDB81DRAFT_297151 [Dactylonectria macrodidyma]|uniref:Uncharacterized protein n=1 Tax=Dactylonectria macrodidyma TaxID=307937 RepID=A0A9P9ICI3_9HYPO|nr:hypothetical protein EDB81DRAFT_297151 [Dactylonectria macrodidyma]